MKWSVLFINFFFVLCHYGKVSGTGGIHESVKDPDVYRNVSEIISSKGYSVEDHTVQTADGYLLSVQRIPHGKKSSFDCQEKEVVLLIHGIFSDATSWVINFPGQSLGFILPDEGYDVWLLNTRGSDYSKRHVKYKTHQRQFWKFSFSEVGEYDMPATIDYILKVSGKEYLHIIAFSQGTMASFAMLSEMPDYNNKVKLLVALAPTVFLRHHRSPVLLIVPFKNQIAFLNDLFSHGEFAPDNQFIKIFREHFFSKDDQEPYEDILFGIGGVDRTQLNETRHDVYASHIPSSTSTKNLVHLGQLVESGKFRKYDYGRHRNLKYYQQEEPPDYNTSHITTAIALIWSTKDFLGDSKDIDLLRKSLNSVVFDYCVPYPYNHLDFIFAENAVKLIYEPVLHLLAKYSASGLLST